jgi:hypothetical protein
VVDHANTFPRLRRTHPFFLSSRPERPGHFPKCRRLLSYSVIPTEATRLSLPHSFCGRGPSRAPFPNMSSRPKRPGFFLRTVLVRRAAQWRDRGNLARSARSMGPNRPTMTFPSPFPPPRRYPDRSGQHFPALVSLSAGRVVEGSWQDRSATQLDVTQPTHTRSQCVSLCPCLGRVAAPSLRRVQGWGRALNWTYVAAADLAGSSLTRACLASSLGGGSF